MIRSMNGITDAQRARMLAGTTEEFLALSAR